jgi:hypothetical protein
MTATGEQPTPPKRPRTIFRAVAEFLIVTLCAVAIGGSVDVLLLAHLPGPLSGARDFVPYWATGQQLARHANPYDGDALLRIERAVGFPSGAKVLFMRNPPWALPLALPLGFLGFRAASILWSLLLLACLVVSVRMLWVMHGRPKNLRYVLGYTFGPAIICLINGQPALIALLGLVLFLRLQRTHPFLAGVSLWLCTLKPHLFLPFGVVLLGWIVVSKSYRVLAGAGIAIAVSSAVVFFLDPLAWKQYSEMVRTYGMQRDYIPCLSFYLRLWLSPQAVWVQYLPVALACVWALGYYWPRRAEWDWMKHGSPLMLVSILAAPYVWLYDQVLVIPALLQGAYLTRSRNMLAALALLSALVELALFGNIVKAGALYLWTIWTAPAWLAWYLFAGASADGRRVGPALDSRSDSAGNLKDRDEAKDDRTLGDSLQAGQRG